MSELLPHPPLEKYVVYIDIVLLIVVCLQFLTLWMNSFFWFYMCFLLHKLLHGEINSMDE